MFSLFFFVQISLDNSKLSYYNEENACKGINAFFFQFTILSSETVFKIFHKIKMQEFLKSDIFIQKTIQLSSMK